MDVFEVKNANLEDGTEHPSGHQNGHRSQLAVLLLPGNTFKAAIWGKPY